MGKKIGFIGGGNMASAFISRMAAIWDNKSDIHVTDISREKLEELKVKYSVSVHAEKGSWLDELDCVVLAVKPQNLPEAIAQIKPYIQKCLVLSIAAGVRTGDLEKMIGHKRICRVMPNTPVKVGLGVCGIYLTEDAKSDKQLVEMLLQNSGNLIWCPDEDMIESITSISGSGPAYVFVFLEALERAALDYGFSPEVARELAIYTVLGSARLAQDSPESFTALSKAVQSKGGTTIEAVKIIEGSGFSDMMQQAIKACRKRAVELGEEFSSKVKA